VIAGGASLALAASGWLTAQTSPCGSIAGQLGGSRVSAWPATLPWVVIASTRRLPVSAMSSVWPWNAIPNGALSCPATSVAVGGVFGVVPLNASTWLLAASTA
jgi:hypothetical protein